MVVFPVPEAPERIKVEHFFCPVIGFIGEGEVDGIGVFLKAGGLILNRVIQYFATAP